MLRSVYARIDLNIAKKAVHLGCFFNVIRNEFYSKNLAITVLLVERRPSES